MSNLMENMLANALKEVKSHDDAEALAHVVLKLTEQSKDLVWAHAEREVLVAVIEEVSKSANTQNFSNIFAILRGDFEAALMDNPSWLEFKEHTTENFQRCAVNSLQRNISPLRGLTAACYAV
jgi:hypothetical protein